MLSKGASGGMWGHTGWYWRSSDSSVSTGCSWCAIGMLLGALGSYWCSMEYYWGTVGFYWAATGVCGVPEWCHKGSVGALGVHRVL